MYKQAFPSLGVVFEQKDPNAEEIQEPEKIDYEDLDDVIKPSNPQKNTKIETGFGASVIIDEKPKKKKQKQVEVK